MLAELQYSRWNLKHSPLKTNDGTNDGLAMIRSSELAQGLIASSVLVLVCDYNSDCG